MPAFVMARQSPPDLAREESSLVSEVKDPTVAKSEPKKTLKKPADYEPSEQVDADVSVPFPVDI